MRFPLFVLPKNCSGQLSSKPWRARGTVVSCAKKPVGVPSCRARPAQPPRRAPPDPTRPWCVRVLDSTSDGNCKTSSSWKPISLARNYTMRKNVLVRTQDMAENDCVQHPLVCNPCDRKFIVTYALFVSWRCCASRIRVSPVTSGKVYFSGGRTDPKCEARGTGCFNS